MRRLIPITFILAVILVCVFWWFSPAEVIKRRTNNLLQTMTLERGSGKSGRQLGAYTLNALLADEVELRSDSHPQANGMFDRSQLESGYSWICEEAEESLFELMDIHSVTIDGDHGTVHCSMKAMIALPGSRPVDGEFDATLKWTLQDDAWRLEGATWEER